MQRLTALLQASCAGLGQAMDAAPILKSTLKDPYDGVPAKEVRKSAVPSARSLIEKELAYSFVTARLLLQSTDFEVFDKEFAQEQSAAANNEYFPAVNSGTPDCRTRC